MNTIIETVTGDLKRDAAVYEKAGEVLRSGGLVAFPTETVYGLGGNGFDAGASQKIYAAKGRPSDNPLILHIADREMLDDITDEVSDKAEKLIEKFWPGPLTMIFNKKDNVPYETTGGLDTVAVRMPSLPAARYMIRAAKTAIAAPSANVSGRPSPTLAKHVSEDLDGRIEMIIDGGSVGIGLESTIIDMTCEPPVILRPGYITKEMFEEVIGRVEVDPAITSKPAANLRPKAPGMKYRHYAPRAELTLVEGDTAKVVEKISGLARERLKDGKKVGIIVTEETESDYRRLLSDCGVQGAEDKCVLFMLGSRSDEESIARNLYAVLRDCDEEGVDYIFSETFSSNNLGEAIMNRLRKAAGYNIMSASESTCWND